MADVRQVGKFKGKISQIKATQRVGSSLKQKAAVGTQEHGCVDQEASCWGRGTLTGVPQDDHELVVQQLLDFRCLEVDHGTLRRAARLLPLQTEDHAASEDDDEDGLWGKAIKLRHGRDSGRYGAMANLHRNRTRASRSWAVQGHGAESAAQGGHADAGTGAGGRRAAGPRPPGTPRRFPRGAALRPATCPPPRACARSQGPITASRGSAQFRRQQGGPASCSRTLSGGQSVLQSLRPAEPVRPA